MSLRRNGTKQIDAVWPQLMKLNANDGVLFSLGKSTAIGEVQKDRCIG